MDYTFRPIQQWPGKLKTGRRSSPFRAAHSKNLRDLERELAHQRARNVVIQLALDDSDLRLDGLPRAGANPRHPGVILTFEKPGPMVRQGASGPLVEDKSRATTLNFPCDTYATWQENLRAIVLALAALRAVDRYGVTQNNEQYRGWAQLPPPAVVTPEMPPRQAAEFIASQTDGIVPFDILHDAVRFTNAYRRAALKLHPDTNNGQQRPEWTTLQQAKGVLDRHHGIL